MPSARVLQIAASLKLSYDTVFEKLATLLDLPVSQVSARSTRGIL